MAKFEDLKENQRYGEVQRILFGSFTYSQALERRAGGMSRILTAFPPHQLGTSLCGGFWIALQVGCIERAPCKTASRPDTPWHVGWSKPNRNSAIAKRGWRLQSIRNGKQLAVGLAGRCQHTGHMGRVNANRLRGRSAAMTRRELGLKNAGLLFDKQPLSRLLLTM